MVSTLSRPMRGPQGALWYTRKHRDMPRRELERVNFIEIFRNFDFEMHL